MKLLIKIPTRERGFEWLRIYTENITNPDTRILLTLDSDQPAPPQWVKDDARIKCETDASDGKIHAINRDINLHIDEFDVLLIGSDDMWPTKRGFDQIILDDMAEYFPDTDGCLWYNTEDAERELKRRYHRPIPIGSREFYEKWICMLPVMGKAYYKRFGYVYHYAYKSFWCDNEYTRVALNFGYNGGHPAKIRFINNRIIEHQHPDWGGAMARDGLYKRTNADYKRDWDVFLRRQRQGFK